jgi:glutamyl-tRNA synthetase
LSCLATTFSLLAELPAITERYQHQSADSGTAKLVPAMPGGKATMPLPQGAGRYAPSPTGQLHLGNLRTAVLAWLFARSTGRRFLLRIEDLDFSRVRPGLAEQQCADLAALGLDFDEPLVIQSKRMAAYQRALEQLAGQSYECFCTRREIAEAASAPHGSVPRYPGTCRDLTDAQRAVRRAVRSAALRLRADGAFATIHDLLHGDLTGPVDDFVIRRNDGVPAYNLAVVVDDAETGVDQVVRGDDLLPSAINQAFVAGLLGYPAPTYGHVPLAVNASGVRLAKRDGAVTLPDLASLGVSPGEVLAMIAESLQLATSSETVELSDLLERFQPERIPRGPWVVQGLPRPSR